MQMMIADMLAVDELRGVRSAMDELRFVDGRATAGWSAALVKANRQAHPGAALSSLDAMVRKILMHHPLFTLAVRPKTLTPLIFARYGSGETYGSHVDDALMNGIRTDVSFTLFLSDPDSYDGGELVIETPSGEDAIKGAAGSLVLYPSTTLHRVNPVRSGERSVCVGWARSFIRSAAHRELLFDLETARRALFTQSGKTPEFDLLSKCSANLLREWAED